MKLDKGECMFCDRHVMVEEGSYYASMTHGKITYVAHKRCLKEKGIHVNSGA